MRKTLADFLRTSGTLRMESAELGAPTEIIAPITVPDGTKVRTRDHIVLLPSPADVGSIRVELQVDDHVIEVTPEQVEITTVDGVDNAASGIRVVDRTIEGQLRIRYQPVAIAQEDGNQPPEVPFVQLGIPEIPGKERKNPFPANAPTERSAPQVTNEPTVQEDKGVLSDKAKIAESAVDQSVAPKVNVTVVERGAAEKDPAPKDKEVSGAEGNTGERKAQEAAADIELRGEPKTDAEKQDNEVNTNGVDPAEAAADVSAEENADAAASSTENDDDQGSEDNAGKKEGEAEEEDIVDENTEEEDELKQESFDVTELNETLAHIASLSFEDEGTKKGFFARALESLRKFLTRIKEWLMDNVFSRGRKKKREDAIAVTKALLVGLKESQNKKEDLGERAVSQLGKAFTTGIQDIAKYKKLMEMLTALGVQGMDEADALVEEGYKSFSTTVNGAQLDAKFEAFFKKYHVGELFDCKFDEDPTNAINKLDAEITQIFKKDMAKGDISNTSLSPIVSTIDTIYEDYNKGLSGYTESNAAAMGRRAKLAGSITAGLGSDQLLRTVRNMRHAAAYCVGAIRIARIIEDAMNRFLFAGEHALGGGADLKTEGFSQPIEVMAVPNDVTPIVIPAERPFVPESLMVSRVGDVAGQTVILRNDKIRTRINEDGLADAIVVVDPDIDGLIVAHYDAVVDGKLVVESDDDPVVTLEIETDDRDGVEIRVAQIVDGDSDEPIPDELVALQEEKVVVLESHQICLKGLASASYLVDMANSPVRFEGDIANAELVMEGMMDSIKSAMRRLGNWFDKNMKYYQVRDMDWRKRVAKITRQLKDIKGREKKADTIMIGRIARRLVVNGEPVTDLRTLHASVAELGKLGLDGKAHLNSMGDLYEDVRKLIAKHDNVNPDGAAILREIPALVKKIDQRRWDSLIKEKRQVTEEGDQHDTSKCFLGDIVIGRMQSLNELTYANPDEGLRKLLANTYVGYNLEWDLDRDLVNAEMQVMTVQEMENLLKAARQAFEAWDIYSTCVTAGKKMDNFYRSLWSLKNYDRDFLSAYGVIIAADQWIYHPVLDLWHDITYPLQGVLRLIEANLAAYK